jgi:hypothetical protein
VSNCYGECKIYRYEYRKEHTIRERVKIDGKWRKFGPISDDINVAARKAMRAKMEQLPERVAGSPQGCDCVEDENPVIRRSNWRYKRFETVAIHNGKEYPASFRIEVRFITTSGQLDASDEGDPSVDDFVLI